MKKRVGMLLMALGVAMLAAAACWQVSNTLEEKRAGDSAAEMANQLRMQLAAVQAERLEGEPAAEAAPMELDGEEYMGVLMIPALGLELPVMRDWSYPKLKKAPCRYYGEAAEDDLVIAAHNYAAHFGGLDRLPEGSTVILETTDGEVHRFKVVKKELLGADEGGKMTDGEFPLTLFTCNYSGSSRVDGAVHLGVTEPAKRR